jgi:ABC-type antimicrobial peptide transport system permease subunit
MAVGMKHGRIFLMVVLESIMLAILGGAVGLVVGAASIAFLGRVGVNLSYASETLATWGSSAIIYPHLPLVEYPKLLLLVIVVAVLSAIYPAIRAVKVNPVKAIRTY